VTTIKRSKATVPAALGRGDFFGERNLDGTDQLDCIPQAHGIRKPAHGLLRVPPLFRVTGLFLVGLRQQGQPAEASGLGHGEVQLLNLLMDDAVTFLLNQES